MVSKQLKKLLPLVYPNERRSFGKMCVLYFLVTFIYNLTRPLKITLVISASDSGAEIIPFLKVWGVIPSAFLFTGLILWLSQKLDREKLFYAVMGIFCGFFFVFSAFLFPFHDDVQLEKISLFLAETLPSGARGFVAMVRYWHLSLFYLFAELWSPMVMTVLFWGFANEVSTMDQAARLYPFINLAGNVAAIASGQMGMLLSENSTDWEQSTHMAVMVSVAATFLSVAIFRSLTQHYPLLPKAEIKIKKKAPLLQSLQGMFHSRYLFYLTIIVLGYNLVFNLTDVLWMDQVKQQYMDDKDALYTYLNQVTFFKGIMSTVFGLFIAQFITRVWGWSAGALVTPIVILGTSLLFFPLMLLGKNLWFSGVVHEYLGTNLLSLAVFVGSLQNSSSRALKYTIYDSTKEMAFIPLDEDTKRRSKTVIDGVGSRLGKSGGALFLQSLLIIFASLEATIPYVILATIFTVLLWIYSIVGLNREMQRFND